MDKLLFKDLGTNLSRGLQLIRLLNFDRDCTLGPIRVEIAATSACTYRCCFCNAHSYLKPDQDELQSLSSDIIHKLIADLKELKVGELLFSGNGEPLLSKVLVKEIKQNGRDFRIELLSNGSTLELVDEELFGNLAFLTISLNAGTGATHQLTHGYQGRNRFFGTLSQIERILRFDKAHNKLKLNYAITADSYNELDDFFMKAIEWDVSFMARPVAIDFPELKQKGLNNEMVDGIREKAAKYLRDIKLSGKLALSFQLLERACNIAPDLETASRPRTTQLYPCYMSFIQPYIASNGDVLLCCTLSGQQPLGNLNAESFSSIWRKKETLIKRIMATQMHKTNRPVMGGCLSCTNVHYHSAAFHSIYTRIPWLPHRLAAGMKSPEKEA